MRPPALVSFYRLSCRMILTLHALRQYRALCVAPLIANVCTVSTCGYDMRNVRRRKSKKKQRLKCRRIDRFPIRLIFSLWVLLVYVIYLKYNDLLTRIRNLSKRLPKGTANGQLLRWNSNGCQWEATSTLLINKEIHATADIKCEGEVFAFITRKK